MSLSGFESVKVVLVHDSLDLFDFQAATKKLGGPGRGCADFPWGSLARCMILARIW